jgi:hypothetical protein
MIYNEREMRVRIKEIKLSKNYFEKLIPREGRGVSYLHLSLKLLFDPQKLCLLSADKLDLLLCLSRHLRALF